MADNYEIGMVGLGVMGRNFLLNIADHGYPSIGFDLEADKRDLLRREGAGKPTTAADTVEEFVASIRAPRAFIMLVPAGRAVDGVIQSLLPHLREGDLICDGGNSHFKDTDLRATMLADKKMHFFGMGISGGEEGARHGPSMMPGGDQKAYERLRPVLEATAANVGGDPCVTWLGPGSAGHYVKMVHNGIEYGLLQLIAETYDLMHRGLGLDEDQMHDHFEAWNQAELSSFLLEITIRILKKVDAATGKRLVNQVLDVARQKGTGKWTSQDAMDLQSPVPTIDAAVSLRDLSGYEQERQQASKALAGPSSQFTGDKTAFIETLRRALYASFVIAYAQGMSQLRKASTTYAYNLKLADIAKIWRGGCIIRAGLLEPIRAAYSQSPDLANLLLEPALGSLVVERQADLRQAIKTAIDLGIPTPALSASLAYFDGYRSARLPANLIQAQRDYFGAHTYERVDQRGIFHTQWANPNAG